MAPLKDYSPFTESKDGEPTAQQRDPCACITLWQCGLPACAAAGAASIGRTPRQRISADAIAFVDFGIRHCGARLGQNGLRLNSGQADEETASFWAALPRIPASIGRPGISPNARPPDRRIRAKREHAFHQDRRLHYSYKGFNNDKGCSRGCG